MLYSALSVTDERVLLPSIRKKYLWCFVSLNLPHVFPMCIIVNNTSEIFKNWGSNLLEWDFFARLKERLEQCMMYGILLLRVYVWYKMFRGCFCRKWNFTLASWYSTVIMLTLAAFHIKISSYYLSFPLYYIAVIMIS